MTCCLLASLPCAISLVFHPQLPAPCLSPPLLPRPNSWLATRLGGVGRTMRLFIPSRQRELILPSPSVGQIQEGKRLRGREKLGPIPALHPHPSHPQTHGRTSFPTILLMLPGARPTSFGWQAPTLERCLLGEATCGHGLRQGAFVWSHLRPRRAHSILK